MEEQTEAYTHSDWKGGMQEGYTAVGGCPAWKKLRPRARGPGHHPGAVAALGTELEKSSAVLTLEKRRWFNK